jgi:hypothetical protein
MLNGLLWSSPSSFGCFEETQHECSTVLVLLVPFSVNFLVFTVTVMNKMTSYFIQLFSHLETQLILSYFS